MKTKEVKTTGMHRLSVLLAASLILLLTTSACLQGKRATDSDKYITKKVKVDRFNKIHLQGSPNITYQHSSQHRVEIYGNSDIVPLLETFVDGKTLIVRFKKNTRIYNSGRLEVKVFAPEINECAISGSGNIRFDQGIQTKENISFRISGSGNIQGKDIQCKAMDITIAGSGNVKLEQTKSKECTVGISGSGNVRLDGTTDKAEYRISGSGHISTDQLKADNVTANTTGSGSICCYAGKKLTARATGSGSISYRGNPQQVDAPQQKIRAIR